MAIGYWLLLPETITDYFLCKDSFFWNHRETFMQSVTTAELRRDGNSLNHCYCCASGHLVILTCAEDVPVGSGLTDDLTSTCWASLVLTEGLSSRYFRTTAFANNFFPKTMHLDWGPCLLSSHFMDLCPYCIVSCLNCFRNQNLNVVCISRCFYMKSIPLTYK